MALPAPPETGDLFETGGSDNGQRTGPASSFMQC
jgi:hypothetical protein